MSSLFQSLIFGIVQGIGEFVPISSTAHLILVPYFTGWKDPGLSFDVALHLGTLIAVLAYFWKDWVNILNSSWLNVKRNGVKGFKNDLLFYLIIATVPGVIFGLLLEKKAESIFRSPILIALTLIIAGMFLYWADKKWAGKKEIKDLNIKNALIIGLAQAFAVIPGVSRSGATITAGLWQKLNKISAARFSFLLSTPIIAGAALLKLPSLLKNGLDTFLIVGILSSAISGFLAIKFLLKFLEKYGYGLFFWYRLILGIIILLFYFFK